ncbi:MAG: hypothetical protein NDI61_11020 [Bdellovibrionaceae bacterium]|nr:hypothetical protein [Pseudobdellovibrionaceae bacterium]
MKKILVQIAVACAIGILAWEPAFAQGAEAEVLTFRAWKTMRVEDAKATLERIQAESGPERGIPAMERPTAARSQTHAAGRVQKGGKGESRLQQAQINFEFATELTINDYFVLYLSQIRSEATVLEAAKKMSAEEVAQLMLAFKKQLEIGRSSVGMLPQSVESLRPLSSEKSQSLGL